MRASQRRQFRVILADLPYEQRDALLELVCTVALVTLGGVLFDSKLAGTCAFEVTESIAEFLDEEVSNA